MCVLGGDVGFLDEVILRVEGATALWHEVAQFGEGSVALQFAQLRGVGKHDVEIIEHASAQRRIVYRPGDFHAFVQVARHEVGAR